MGLDQWHEAGTGVPQQGEHVGQRDGRPAANMSQQNLGDDPAEQAI